MRLIPLLLFITFSARAQLTLRGQVLNAADGQPVPFCSVFLANTTKGTTADEQGQFVLTNVPAGRFELVASSVGFETQAMPLPADPASTWQIRLRPATNQLAEVQVRASRDPQWLENLATFQQLFIGTSQNARQCAIVNPGALWFDDNRAARTLTAGAREPLVITNQALGYQIRYALTRFVYEYGRSYVSYLGYPVYEPLKPRNRREASRWAKARKEAYLGSPMHFMRALHQRRVEAEGFELRRVLERTDSNSVDGTGQVKKARYLLNDKLPGTFLIDTDASSDSLTVLTFSNLIQVTYTRERESADYRRWLSPFGDNAQAAAPPQTSVIYLTEPAVTVEANGNFYNQLGLVFEQYWSWEKLADLLPLTYQP